MQIIKLLKEPRLEAKHDAYAYQKEAVRSICKLDYAAIFHEQGLGKSKIAIDLMIYWLENKLIDTVLFVVKKSLIHNWKREFSIHTFIKPKILDQDKNSNFYVFNSPSRLLLTHYEVIKSEKNRFQIFLKTRNVAVILDESTKIKNPDSNLTKSFFHMAPLFKKRIIMTGTPVANRPYDIWAQIHFLDGGKSLGNDFKYFKTKSDLDNKLANDVSLQQSFEKNISKIFSKIQSFTVRETKNNNVIHLPEKEIETVITQWEPHQFELYNRYKEELRAVIEKDGLPTIDNAEVVLKRLLRLVQIASNPKIVDKSYTNIPGKYEYLKDLLWKNAESGEKCIVWSSFVYNVDWLAKEFKEFGTCKVHGRMHIESRNNSIERFLSDKSYKVLVATPGAAKEGLTLTVANHVIFFDRSFSLDDYLQAQDRIHRISQVKTCYVHNFVMENSIDEWVDCLLDAKELAAKLAQGDIGYNEYIEKISYDFGNMIKEVINA